MPIVQLLSIGFSAVAIVIATWSAHMARSTLELRWRPYVVIRWADREDGTWLEMHNSGQSSAYSISVSLDQDMPWAHAKENPFRYWDVLHPGESYMEKLQGDQTRHERRCGHYVGRVGWNVTVRYRAERDILPKKLKWHPRSIVTSLDMDLNPQIGFERHGREYHHVYQIMF